MSYDIYPITAKYHEDRNGSGSTTVLDSQDNVLFQVPGVRTWGQSVVDDLNRAQELSVEDQKLEDIKISEAIESAGKQGYDQGFDDGYKMGLKDGER